MKTIIITFLLLLSVICKGQQKIGYHVFIDYGKVHRNVKTTNIVEVYTLLQLVLPNNCINIEKQLEKTYQPSFSVYIGEQGIYIEKKRVVRIKKNGELILRRYKIKKGHN